MMRECRKCGAHLELSAFSKDKSRKDGLNPRCKACVVSERKPKTPEQKARIADNTRRYKARHPERIRERKRRWYRERHDKALAQQRAWVEKNREKVRLYIRSRNAMRRANGGRWKPAVIAQLMQSQRGKCVVCRAAIEARFHVDHILPLALGGGNEAHNIQLLCVDCNLRKKDKHPVTFMQTRGYLL